MISEHGTEDIALFPYEDIRRIGSNLPFYLVAEVKSLQLHLKNLQKEGLYSIDDIFDYSSIDESVFRNFVNYPTSTHQISSRIDTITVPSPSRKYI